MRLGIAFERAGQPGKRVGRDPVVGIKDKKEAARRLGDAAVARCRAAFRRAGRYAGDQADAAVARGIGLGDVARGVGRAVVDDQRFPVRTRLGLQAVQRRG
jgi:hypothetical protein